MRVLRDYSSRLRAHEPRARRRVPLRAGTMKPYDLAVEVMKAINACMVWLIFMAFIFYGIFYAST